MEKIFEGVKNIVKAIDDKKGVDIKVLDLQGITEIADYFVIATGNNKAHISSLSDNVEEKLKEIGFEVVRKQGQDEGEWIILDYGDIVVHLFREETRRFYDLEKFWRSAKTVEIAI
ncbi:ribosome silencing factor [Alkalicella caledoniensis]|uniref:Ribosomal silencing factor RsfS n=1 Tax=Alkalicella caledoniensis TaxID=2731377 RepID=A0A7G9W4H7_ALKCA|nr:ribosome silencing factor [Alkalicella caledoniensis]QNO13589.1 ribosome silencing factor [Alkalicella caledoniensis]